MNTIFFMFVSVLLSNPLFAMTSILVPEKEKIQKAAAIVLVNCVNTKTESGGKEKKVIFTTYELQMLASPIKGKLPKAWTGFTLPGGHNRRQDYERRGCGEIRKRKVISAVFRLNTHAFWS